MAANTHTAPTPTQVLRQVARAIEALADMMEVGPAPAPELVPLTALPIKPRAARAMIARGELPAVRRGRAYLVRREDVERVFAPTIRSPPARNKRESETARLHRQLAAAGIVANDSGRTGRSA